MEVSREARKGLGAGGGAWLRIQLLLLCCGVRRSV